MQMLKVPLQPKKTQSVFISKWETLLCPEQNYVTLDTIE